jgi:hypothetical protein
MQSKFPQHFNLPDAQTYKCKLESIAHDQTVYIEIFKTYIGGERYILTLHHTLYVKMPFSWRGAHFILGSEAETLEVINCLNESIFAGLQKDDLLRSHHLYLLDNSFRADLETAMYILAGDAVIEEKKPYRRKKG